jgi:hypothetical protein
VRRASWLLVESVFVASALWPFGPSFALQSLGPSLQSLQ